MTVFKSCTSPSKMRHSLPPDLKVWALCFVISGVATSFLFPRELLLLPSGNLEIVRVCSPLGSVQVTIPSHGVRDHLIDMD
jgi:hypothetical protein